MSLQWTGERVVPTEMHADPRTYQEHLARYVWALGHVAGLFRVLDAACGCGYGAELLSHVTLGRTVGVDIDEGAIAYARAYYPQIDWYLGDLQAGAPHGYSSNHFDAITSFETIEHLALPLTWLERAKALLRPGGLFLFSIPLNAPSEFHKTVFADVGAVANLIAPAFPQYALYTQTGTDIRPLTGAPGQFILGIGKGR